MKVTDDMVYRLGQCLVERAYNPYGGGTDDDLRYALAQALANERDGEWYMANLKQALDEDLAERVELQKRLASAEAKLEAALKVRHELLLDFGVLGPLALDVAKKLDFLLDDQ